MQNLEKYEEQVELLKALAHPIRLCIVKGLLEKQCNVTHMQECLQLPQSTVSQHLGILRAKGIVKGYKSGLEITYRVISKEAERVVRALQQEE